MYGENVLTSAEKSWKSSFVNKPATNLKRGQLGHVFLAEEIHEWKFHHWAQNRFQLWNDVKIEDLRICVFILLMEEILHHLGWLKPTKNGIIIILGGAGFFHQQ